MSGSGSPQPAPRTLKPQTQVIQIGDTKNSWQASKEGEKATVLKKMGGGGGMGDFWDSILNVIEENT